MNFSIFDNFLGLLDFSPLVYAFERSIIGWEEISKSLFQNLEKSIFFRFAYNISERHVEGWALPDLEMSLRAQEVSVSSSCQGDFQTFHDVIVTANCNCNFHRTSSSYSDDILKFQKN